MANEGLWLGISILVGIAVVVIIASGIRIVRPYQKGLVERLGSFIGMLNPGFHLVFPVITRVTLMDLRLQTLDVARQEVITKDNSPTNVDAVIYIKIMDPYKAYYEVQNYRQATVFLAQTTLRSVIGEMELDEILYNREVINAKLRDILDTATDAWGVKVDAVEIRQFTPALDSFNVREWYRFLNCGYRVTAVGGTDKMSAGMPVGGVRTYAHLGDEEFAFANWAKAVRAGHTFTTSGPLIGCWSRGTRRGMKCACRQAAARWG